MSEKNETQKATAPNQGRNNRNQQSNRRSQQRPVFVQTRKAVPYVLTMQSNAMLDYMKQNGGAAAGSFQRVAVLMQLTANEKVIRTRLDEWFNGVIENAKGRVNFLIAQQEKYAENAVFNIPKPEVPDNYKQVVEVTHPIFWKLTGLVETIDLVMGDLEYLWLSGQLEDIHLENATGQAVNIIKTMTNRIYYVTNASRGRKDGLYSKAEFDSLMKALVNNEDAPTDNESQEQPVAEKEAKEVTAAVEKKEQVKPSKSASKKAVA